MCVTRRWQPFSQALGEGRNSGPLRPMFCTGPAVDPQRKVRSGSMIKLAIEGVRAIMEHVIRGVGIMI